jgi:Lar family restriction alleviation protein
MSAEIKPCPFCGDPDPAIDEVDMDVWAVVCNDCGAIGPTQNDDGKINLGPKAIELWNGRS